MHSASASLHPRGQTDGGNGGPRPTTSISRACSPTSRSAATWRAAYLSAAS